MNVFLKFVIELSQGQKQGEEFNEDTDLNCHIYFSVNQIILCGELPEMVEKSYMIRNNTGKVVSWQVLLKSVELLSMKNF